MANNFVLYDPIIKGYLKGWEGGYSSDWRKAKHYKTLAWAKSPETGAGLMNVSRNLPPGFAPEQSLHYENKPNVEVHEFDDQGAFVKSHAAPPQYITLT